ncbi:4-hydroxy-tetrahydrodipicolinate reductase [Robiginitalea sp. SC105]|uniref:4-hydroxy-tetrahydrodipicolinate reductase n=1 Tax=Robiginitalea sp. SC105 TaxID=2762332 RepID=UPI00163994CA|nr:4-hydroxy-tetrahydrodipicolinate reductase [Robiginitalea sp. SC105]MBC2839239.1 4-hydroxy-tetrahydrodipicolinate reductase [Robiginitalea sp. SC105]
MKIGLFGYGKMGKMIEGLAPGRGHEIRARIDGPGDVVPFGELDVAIDFSSPEAAFDNIARCLEAGVPVISGTTGWLERYGEITRKCEKLGGAFIYASNFSLGVNLFFSLNEYLAGLMAKNPGYRASIVETHHTQKLDAPSGTAITLAEGVLSHTDYDSWSPDPETDRELPVQSRRLGDVPGTHVVSWNSSVDRIDITHTAHNREGFALGALVAAEWLVGKKGVYSMKDVLNLR